MGSSLVKMPKTVTEQGSSCQPKRAQRRSNQEENLLDTSGRSFWIILRTRKGQPMKQIASKPLHCEKTMNENFRLDFLIFTI